MAEANDNIPDAVITAFKKNPCAVFSMTGDSNSAHVGKVREAFHFFVRIKNEKLSNSEADRARFVYCWEWFQNSKQWEKKGLFMTDHEGVLINIPDYISRCGSVKEFTVKEEKCPLQPLDKNSISRLFRNPKEALYIASYFSAVSTKKSRVVFLRSSDYFFTFCPPEIIDPNTQVGLVPQPSNGEGQHDKLCKDSEIKIDRVAAEPDHTLTNVPPEPNEEITDQRLMFWEKPCSLWYASPENVKKFGYLLLHSWDLQLGKLYTACQWEGVKIPYEKFNVLSLNLPVTFEEQISRLGWDVHLLDLQYTTFLNIVTGYFDACKDVEQLSFWLNMSRNYPGFTYKEVLKPLPNSSYNGESSRAGQTYKVEIPERVKLIENKNVALSEVINNVKTFRDELEQYTASSSNKTLVGIHALIYKAKQVVKERLKNKDLINKLIEWNEFLKSHSSGQIYPYSIKTIPVYIDDINVLFELSPSLKSMTATEETVLNELKKYQVDQLVIYQVVFEAFSTLFACRAGAENGVPSQDVIDAQNMEIVKSEFLELENILLNEFIAFGKKDKSKKSLIEEFLEILREESAAVNGEVFDTLSANEKEDLKIQTEVKIEYNTLLGVLFTELKEKVIPGLWNTQAGPDSAITAIWRLSVFARSTSMFIGKTDLVKQCRNFIYFCMDLGLIIKLFKSAATRDTFKALFHSCSRQILSPNRKIAENPIIAFKNAVNKIRNGTGAGKSSYPKELECFNSDPARASALVTNVTSIIGVTINVLQFYNAVKNGAKKNYEFSPDELIKIGISIHGAGICLSGINVGYSQKIALQFEGLSKNNSVFSKMVSANAAKGNIQKGLCKVGGVFSYLSPVVNLYLGNQEWDKYEGYKNIGKSLYSNLHFLNSLTYFSIAVVQTIALGSPTMGPVVGPVVAASCETVAGIFMIISLIIDGVIMILNSIEKGMEKLYEDVLIKIVMNKLFTDGRNDWFYIPLTEKFSTDVSEEEKDNIELTYHFNSKIHSKEKWDGIKNDINVKIKPFQNLCLIHAGAILRTYGCSDEKIALITKGKNGKIWSQENMLINKCIAEGNSDECFASNCADHDNYTMGVLPNNNEISFMGK